MDTLTGFEAAYLETALWSSTDHEDTALDSGRYEVAPQTMAAMKDDCAQFIERARAQFGIDAAEQHAHDFWLTRNRHGAGFWDGDYPEPIGQQLTDLSHSFGESELYVGDDALIYILGREAV